MKFEILIISLWTLSGNSRLLLSRYSLLHNEYARFKRASWFNWREFGLKTCTHKIMCVCIQRRMYQMKYQTIRCLKSRDREREF